MKPVYMLRVSLFAFALSFAFAVSAQSPTIISNSTNCNFVKTFTASDEGFSSPSIYSSSNDVSFFWNSTAGALVESSGLVTREGSLISSTFTNTTQGQTTVGFSYVVPAGSEYRLRIISGATNPPLEILATTANGPVWTPLAGTSGTLCLQVMDADLNQNGAIRFEFSFRAVAPGNMVFDNFSLAATNIPLPVTFLGFVARKNDDGTVKLLWNVADEVDVRGYDVETSTNGSDFTSVGFVNATGKNVYTLQQNQPLTETKYFRIKNVDIDGKFKYSGIIRIYAKEKNGPISIYPVPANDQVYLQHNKASEKSVITVISMDGKTVRRITPAPSTLQTVIHIDDLKTGLYMVRFDDGQGNVETAKLIKN